MLRRPREVRPLRARLLAFISWPLLALLALSVFAEYRSAVHIADQAYDNALSSTAIALATRLERDDDDVAMEVDLPPAADEILRADPYDQVRYLVVSTQGKLIAGDTPLLALPRPVPSNRVQLGDAVLEGQPVRTAAYHYVGKGMDAYVLVTETLNKRRTAAGQILFATIGPNVLIIAAALLLVYFGVRVALRPLDDLSDQIAGRSGLDFRPLVESEAPGETRALVRSINRLMSDLDEAGHAQQAFLSNAAHQLRTPLAGLQTQLELTLGELPPDARHRVSRLQEPLGRLAHLTQQMLALARSSSDAVLAGERRPVQLHGLAAAVVDDFLDAAVAKDIDLGLEPGEATVQGSAWMLREMLANLVENAIRYLPRGGRITLRCGPGAAGGACIEVEDDGPGIPEAARASIFERFRRGGDTTAPGSGLGLAIVREVADRHGAALTLSNGAAGRGALFHLDFPASQD